MSKQIKANKPTKASIEALAALPVTASAIMAQVASEPVASEPVASEPVASEPATSGIAQLLEQVANGKASAMPTVAVKSAKQYIRELLSANGAEMSLAQLCVASGKTPVNVATMLADLRTPKYAGGKAGVVDEAGLKAVFLTKSCKRDGVTYYSKA